MADVILTGEEAQRFLVFLAQDNGDSERLALTRLMRRRIARSEKASAAVALSFAANARHNDQV